MLLINEWVKNEIKEEIKEVLETSENELTATQNFWDTAKAVLRGKFIAITSLPKKKKRKETFQTSNLTVHLQELGEQQQQAQSMRKEGNIQDQSRIK